VIINCGALLTGAALTLRSTDSALLTASPMYCTSVDCKCQITLHGHGLDRTGPDWAGPVSAISSGLFAAHELNWTELEFANWSSEHVRSNGSTKWLSTNRPSFVAANQVATLTRVTNKRVLSCNWVDLLQVSLVQFSLCTVDKAFVIQTTKHIRNDDFCIRQKYSIAHSTFKSIVVLFVSRPTAYNSEH